MSQIKDKRIKNKGSKIIFAEGKNSNSLRTTNYELRSKKGFTLVELIVSVGVFSIVMLVAVGALFSLLAANQRAQSLKVVMNNLNLAMENMVKDIRVGTHYHCGNTGNIAQPRDCASGDGYFAFELADGDTSSANDQVVFRVQSGSVQKSEDGGSSFVSITSPDAEIEYLFFRVFGSGSGDGQQPRVLIRMGGVAGLGDDTQTSFNIESMATQRLLDS